MKTHPRFSLALLVSLLIALPLVSQGAARGQDAPLLIASGDTRQTSTVLWALSRELGALTFDYGTDSTFSTVEGTLRTEVTDPTLPVKAFPADLKPKTRYYYRVTTAKGTSAIGSFQTAALPDTFAGLRFGASGDWRQDLVPYPSIKNVPQRQLAFFVKLGDTIYADFPSRDVPIAQARTLAEFRAKHAEAISERYGMNTWGEVRASTSILASIDDHEVTNDFAGGAPPSSDSRFDQKGAFINETDLYAIGLQAFHEYMPIVETFYGETGDPRTAGKRKLYRALTYGRDAMVILLDNRSFRDAALPGVTEFTRPNIQAFNRAAFDPSRTMLGKAQLADLKADLLRAQQSGLTWKFVMVAEPIQNFGPIGAPDRFEGYAAERTEILEYIVNNNITNVVFISADIHGSLTNNLVYQTAFDGPQNPTRMWEITTGPVAFDAPFGPTVVQLGVEVGLLTPAQQTTFNVLPISGKDAFIARLMEEQLKALGLDTPGLDGSGIEAKLLRGGYVAANTYGWTEFEVDAATQALTVTTYGIPPYSQAQMEADPARITARTPAIISQFTVQPMR